MLSLRISQELGDKHDHPLSGTVCTDVVISDSQITVSGRTRDIFTFAPV